MKFDELFGDYDLDPYDYDSKQECHKALPIEFEGMDENTELNQINLNFSLFKHELKDDKMFFYIAKRKNDNSFQPAVLSLFMRDDSLNYQLNIYDLVSDFNESEVLSGLVTCLTLTTAIDDNTLLIDFSGVDILMSVNQYDTMISVIFNARVTMSFLKLLNDESIKATRNEKSLFNDDSANKSAIIPYQIVTESDKESSSSLWEEIRHAKSADDYDDGLQGAMVPARPKR